MQNIQLNKFLSVKLRFLCHRTRRNRKGSALLITLLILALLTSLTVEFAYEVYLGTAMFSNWSNSQKASLIAKSGQTIGGQYIKSLDKFSYTYIAEVMLPVKKDFGHNSELVIRLEDENAKFNINSIIFQNGLTNEEAFESLKKMLEYLTINPAVAQAVADWIDPDSEPRLKDSEYQVKNTYLWSVDELRDIRGIDEKTFKKIEPYITVFGNNRKININTAKLPVLVGLHPDMTETLAERIMDYRKNSPFEDSSHIQRVSGMEVIGPLLIGKVITVKSSYFRLIAEATVDEITRITESVIDSSQKVQYWKET
jgi:general secretion pathway protein K